VCKATRTRTAPHPPFKPARLASFPVKTPKRQNNHRYHRYQDGHILRRMVRKDLGTLRAEMNTQIVKNTLSEEELKDVRLD
jgi:hypothetical protein